MSARRDLEGAWAELTGMCAKALGRPARANPYRKASAERRRWSAGHRFYQPNVSREAMKQPGPGRGRSKLGLRREWRPEDDAVLMLYQGAETSDATGARIGKTGQACRNRLHRLRRRTDAEARP